MKNTGDMKQKKTYPESDKAGRVIRCKQQFVTKEKNVGSDQGDLKKK